MARLQQSARRSPTSRCESQIPTDPSRDLPAGVTGEVSCSRACPPSGYLDHARSRPRAVLHAPRPPHRRPRLPRRRRAAHADGSHQGDDQRRRCQGRPARGRGRAARRTPTWPRPWSSPSRHAALGEAVAAVVVPRPTLPSRSQPYATTAARCSPPTKSPPSSTPDRTCPALCPASPTCPASATNFAPGGSLERT